MNRYHQICNQQLLQEAEGYLDLIMSMADLWPARRSLSDRLAHRALNTLKQILPDAANHSHVFYLRGQALRLLDEHAAAIAPLKEAAELDPTNLQIYLALGWCYKRLGRIDLAIEALEECLEFEDREAIIYYNLACYWSLGGNVLIAVDYLATAFEIDCNFRDLISTEPDFDPIRSDPQFMALTSMVV